MKGSAGAAIKRILPRATPVRDSRRSLSVATLGSFARCVGSGSVMFWPAHATRRDHLT